MRSILFAAGVLILTSVCFFDVSLLVLILGIFVAVSLLYPTLFCGWYDDNVGYANPAVIQPDSVIKVYGQQVVVESITVSKVYLKSSIVVPTREYTRDWCYFEEIEDCANE